MAKLAEERIIARLRDGAFWQKVRSSPEYGPLVDEIRARYGECRFGGDIPVLKFSIRTRFERDGDRREFESPYFRRRVSLSYTALLSLIEPENPVLTEELQDLIWAVTEESCWVLPAHLKFAEAGDSSYIDLFAAETGFALAEISAALGDRLDEKVRLRVRELVKERILDPFKEHPMNWEVTTNNWAAVCAGNVGGALIYLFPEEFPALLPRLLGAMKSFLRGYSDEGICYEGLGYWNYGFGNFTWFAELLDRFTDGSADGRIDLMADPKAEACAGFGQRAFLKGGCVVSFSDTSRSGSVDLALQNFLARRYPGTVRKLPASVACPWGGNTPWMNMLRNLLFFEPPAPEASEEEPVSFFLPAAGQAIVNRRRYSLAVKAGNNDECEGHNDVGTFILSTEKGQIFCDLGSGTYNRDYFDESKRYGIFCVGSRGHSVPIVNGAYQKHGKEYCGTIRQTGQNGQTVDRLELELSGAYGIPGVSRLNRTFSTEEDRITLTDSFEPDYESITERFITLIKPAADGNRVKVGDAVLEYDPEQARLDIHAEEDTGGVGTVWCVDFLLKPGLDRVSFTFLI